MILKLPYHKDMKKDYVYILGILVLLISIPLVIRIYDRSLKPVSLPSNTKEFVLTGHSTRGWILGEINAWNILSFFNKTTESKKPVIRVVLNDEVVLKLRSADVSHGFVLNGYSIYLSKGIEPGSTTYMRFKADKAGTFIFSCTVFCGNIHHSMQGTLVVEE